MVVIERPDLGFTLYSVDDSPTGPFFRIETTKCAVPDAAPLLPNPFSEKPLEEETSVRLPIDTTSRYAHQLWPSEDGLGRGPTSKDPLPTVGKDPSVARILAILANSRRKKPF